MGNCPYEEDDMVEQYKQKEENKEDIKRLVVRVRSKFLSENDIYFQEKRVIRIALFGDANCGKSKLIQTLQHMERLEEENSLTTLDLYRGQIKINGVLCDLEIIDIGG